MIWYSPSMMHLPGMSNFRSWLGNSIFTTELLLYHWLICYLQYYIFLIVNKLENFSSNPGKVNFEGLVHLLRYIRYNKTLGLNYYADMKDEHLFYLLIQANNKTENRFMALYDSSWKYWPYTGRSTGAYIIFYQGGPIDHGTHVPVPFARSSAESEYNTSYTAVMDLSRSRMLIH